jgi:signal peptidase I
MSRTEISGARRASAVALSLLCIAGLGHFVLGRWKRGALWFAALLVAFYSALLGIGVVGMVGLVLPPLVWLGAAVDVARVRADERELPGFGSVFVGWVVLWIGCIVLALLIRGFGMEAFKMPSGSMLPTLTFGDHFFINKVTSQKPPRRGEVIVFKFPENKEQDFVKRVIVVPGDTLEAVNGRPLINGWLVPHCYVGPYRYEGRQAELFVEFLEDESYFTLYDTNPDEQTCKVESDCGAGLTCRRGICGMLQGPFKVAPNEAWVMGDNRNNSHDSRSWRGGLGGGVPFENIKGRAMFVWMSFEPGGGIAQDRLFVNVMGRPKLPGKLPDREAAKLQEALDKCLRERPPVSETTPPPRR